MTWSRTWDVDNIPENAAPQAEPIQATQSLERGGGLSLVALAALACAPTFGEAVAAAVRAEKPTSMTWAVFGKQLGLNPSTLGRVKAGRNLSLATLDNVARRRGWTITISRSA